MVSFKTSDPRQRMGIECGRILLFLVLLTGWARATDTESAAPPWPAPTGLTEVQFSVCQQVGILLDADAAASTARKAAWLGPHSRKVLQHAIDLLPFEPAADPYTVTLVATLHDIGYLQTDGTRQHGLAGKPRVIEMLTSLKVDPARIKAVAKLVAAHHDVRTMGTSPEGRIVFLADKSGRAKDKQAYTALTEEHFPLSPPGELPLVNRGK